VRVISRSALREFWTLPSHGDAEMPLRAWEKLTEAATWNNFADIRTTTAAVSQITDERYVFNIGGQKYRLVVVVRFRTRTVYIRFIGTHKQYDKIDSATI
jgi:mRNA interferase HigB